jgi:hypothetical protein
MTGTDVGTFDINNVPLPMVNYMLGSAANLGPSVAFMNLSGAGNYTLINDSQVKTFIDECFGSIERLKEAAGGKKLERDVLAFIKPKIQTLDRMTADVDAGKYPFMVNLRNQFSETSRPAPLDDMKRFISQNENLAVNAELFWEQSSKNFPAKIIDPEEVRGGAGSNEWKQINKLIDRWKTIRPTVDQLDFSSVTNMGEHAYDPGAVGLSQALHTPATSDAAEQVAQNELNKYIKINDKVSAKNKLKVMDPIEGFSEISIYQNMLNQMGYSHNEPIAMVYGKGKLRGGGKPSYPINTGTWLRNFGMDNGLEGVAVGAEGDNVVVFIPGQGYNRPTVWDPKECEISAEQVSSTW